MRTALTGTFLLLVLAGCGGSGPAATTAVTSAPAATAVATSAPGADAVACSGSGGTAVTVVDFAYDPQSASVSVGGTATWTNEDSAPHTVTFNDGPDCGEIGDGESVSATFGSAGEYSYRCTIHPSMRGVVVVQ